MLTSSASHPKCSKTAEILKTDERRRDIFYPTNILSRRSRKCSLAILYYFFERFRQNSFSFVMAPKASTPLLVLLFVVGTSMMLWYRLTGEPTYEDLENGANIKSMIEQTEADMENTASFDNISGEFITDDYSHIIAVPDVHGDASNYITTLWGAMLKVGKDLGVVIGISYSEFHDRIMTAAVHGEYPLTPIFPNSSVILVSMGDVVERGPDSLLCLRILWSIERVIGWKIVSLYGNHEFFTNMNFPNYVHKDEIAAFGYSQEDRGLAFRTGSPTWNMVSSRSVLVARFSDANNKGIVFSHAGITSEWVDVIKEKNIGSSISDWNKSLRDYYHGADSINNDDSIMRGILHANSPVQSRIYGGPFATLVGKSIVCEDNLKKSLELLNVDFMVVAHTPQEYGMNTDCDDKLIRTDISLSKYMAPPSEKYSGSPGFLLFKITKGKTGFDSISAVYQNPATQRIVRERIFYKS